MGVTTGESNLGGQIPRCANPRGGPIASDAPLAVLKKISSPFAGASGEIAHVEAWHRIRYANLRSKRPSAVLPINKGVQDGALWLRKPTYCGHAR